ncbi:MAG TPA: MAPEG family protein [Noviherbaspirillum sp.]
MHQAAILFPVIALAAWTFAVLMLIPYQRFKAVLNKQISGADFKFGESANVPPHVSIPNRNLMNLLEMPVLFYVACLMLYVTHTASSVVLMLAWIYMALRIMHSLVHLTYNNVIHRLVFFAGSNLVLLAIWIAFSMALAA